jgi:hypothetical protein
MNFIPESLENIREVFLYGIYDMQHRMRMNDDEKKKKENNN